MFHGGGQKCYANVPGYSTKEGKFFDPRLIQKLFEGKLSKQRGVFTQFTSSDRLELVRNKFLFRNGAIIF